MKKGLMGVLVVIFVILLSGCQEKATPEDRLAEYVGHWNKGEFAAMYKDFLNKETKEVFEAEDFVVRQENLQKDLGIENVKVTYTKPAKDTEWDTEKPADFPIKVSMDTVAGSVEFEKTIT